SSAVAPETRRADRYVEAFGPFVKRLDGRGASWLHPIREAALARFAELGFPTTKVEDWRFTNTAPIADTAFRPPRADPGRVSRKRLAAFDLPGGDAPTLVFVNGHFAPALSRPGSLPKGVRVASLLEAIDSDRARVQAHLTRYADFEESAFTALNTAFLEDGAFVFVPRGIVLESPIHILYVSVPEDEPTVAHPRNLIVAEDGTQASIVEEYVALDDGVYFSNAVTELVVGANAAVSHTLVERESAQAYNVETLRIQQARDSTVASHSLLLGGALVRNNVHPVLGGEGCDCLINGLFMGTGHQHLDNYMKVEHAAPHGDSRQFYNGILDDHAHGVFHGRIVVHPGAQKTDAKQTNRNLLLSGEAGIDSKPQLEIYADDVKCTHGATIGQLDPDQIFYLRARGIPEAAARGILLFGFARESLGRIGAEPVRVHLEALVRRWFARANLSDPAG
ncbi:MAG: Fe-S cluster assembly protein SufD, partial [Gemmatimonadota bacterium]